MDAVQNTIEIGASGIETLAVAVIVVTPAHGWLADVFHMRQQVPDAYPRHKVVVVRTFLSWSLVEMEGHWPWKS
jgi:hypothetical protein